MLRVSGAREWSERVMSVGDGVMDLMEKGHDFVDIFSDGLHTLVEQHHRVVASWRGIKWNGVQVSGKRMKR